MWIQFAVACSLCLIILYVFGFPAAFLLHKDWKSGLALSPMYSVSLLSVGSIVFSAAGISCSFESLSIWVVLSSLFLACSIIFIRHSVCLFSDERNCCSYRKDSDRLICMALFLGLGLTTVTLFFVKNLDTAESVFQAFDNGSHLNRIISFIKSSNYSSFNAQTYLVEQGSLRSPYIESSSFYPSAWHGVVAMVASAVNVNVSIAVNAVNSMLLAIVYPLGCWRVFDLCFSKNRIFGYFASFVCIGFSTGVWNFVVFGPLYPMLLSYCLIPLTLSCFFALTKEKTNSSDSGTKSKLINLLEFALGCVAIILSQPSGIFLMGIILAPYCVQRVFEFAKGADYIKWPLISAVITALIICGFWICCTIHPLFSGPVNFSGWPKRDGLFQGVIDAVLLSTVSHPVQLGLSVMVMIGFIVALRSAQYRWIAVSHSIMILSYVLDVSTDGILKRLLCGFWYSDPERIAVNLTFTAVPLAVFGCMVSYTWIRNIIQRYCKERSIGSNLSRVPQFVAVLFAVLVFIPSFKLRGICDIRTGFGAFSSLVADENRIDDSQVLTKEEICFIKKALTLIPEGSGVINEPNDGSGFAYALYGMNTYYRSFDLPSLDWEERDSQVIRSSLKDICINDGARESVDSVGAKYVLLLDQGMRTNQTKHFWSYYPEQWSGIEGITDQTPGFKTILAEKDMRLYKIEG